MDGLKKSKKQMVEDFIQRVNPYEKPTPIGVALREYAAYVADNALTVADITPDIMAKFIKKESEYVMKEETTDYGWNPADPLNIKFPEALGSEESLSLSGDLEMGYIHLYAEAGENECVGYDLTCEQALCLAAYLNRAVREIRAYGVRKCMEIAGVEIRQTHEESQTE